MSEIDAMSEAEVEAEAEAEIGTGTHADYPRMNGGLKSLFYDQRGVSRLWPLALLAIVATTIFVWAIFGAKNLVPLAVFLAAFVPLSIPLSEDKRWALLIVWIVALALVFFALVLFLLVNFTGGPQGIG